MGSIIYITDRSRFYSKVHHIAAIAKSKGYRVTADGGVLGPKGKLLKLRVGDRGYLTFSVNYPTATGKSVFPLTVHRFAAFLLWGKRAFVPGIEVRHLDNDSTNNSASNLALGNSAQNKADWSPEYRRQIVENARLSRLGQPGARAKLTPADVVQIRQRIANGEKQVVIAIDYNVTPMAISRIRHNQAYRYVEGVAA